jgi:hypothetical protein
MVYEHLPQSIHGLYGYMPQPATPMCVDVIVVVSKTNITMCVEFLLSFFCGCLNILIN